MKAVRKKIQLLILSADRWTDMARFTVKLKSLCSTRLQEFPVILYCLLPDGCTRLLITVFKSYGRAPGNMYALYVNISVLN